MPRKLFPDELARFEAKIDKSGDCWIWTGSKLRGYGRFSLRRGTPGRGRYAHRVAYRQWVGPIPEGHRVIRHKCDNPSCVRPAHLEPGTQLDNMGDAVQRGRMSSGARRFNAKLTEAAVLEIRGSSKSGAELAREFGVSESTINRARNRVKWVRVS